MMQFQQELTPEQREMVAKLVGKPVAEDGKTFLFDEIAGLDRRSLSKIARATKQVTTVELPDLGKIVTMRDGTRYEVTARGWIKIT